MTKNILLAESEPIKKLVEGIGKDVKRYFGKDKGCIIGLGDDGFFYGLGFYQWLSQQNKNIVFATMDDNGAGLDEEKAKGRKILIIDNDIVTGKGYKIAMEAMRARKENLKIRDVKFAVLCDRTGLADFSVEGYSAYAPWSLEKLDGTDLKIINELSQDGRRSFVEIAKKAGLSQVAIKNRVEKLIADNFLKIQGQLNISKCYSVSAHIEIEADERTISKLIEKFEKSPLVYQLVKTSGSYNLLVCIVAQNLESIETIIDKEIRRDPGVKHIDVTIGELPIIPKTWNPKIS
ncbi:MAG: Lrp/AsnC family transcriptional regulator [bacterium]|nr:Lrp/AsnC family transcriptional regulator [bacterium]